MKVLYNDNETYCCDWISNLMDAGLISSGKIDDRLIEDMNPEDVIEYERVHFFAGIAGWELALNMAGWPESARVWTGSCPCQPFSQAGKRLGFADDRHLWPAWLWLIEQCRPATIFGEQVANKIGREWFSVVQINLEELDYAVGCADLCAASVGAPHIRQRLFFVGNANSTRLPAWNKTAASVGYGHSFVTTSIEPWAEFEWLLCIDGKLRPVKPGVFPLAHGIPCRVAKLRAIGNSIVPQVAAEFIKAVL